MASVLQLLQTAFGADRKGPCSEGGLGLRGCGPVRLRVDGPQSGLWSPPAIAAAATACVAWGRGLRTPAAGHAQSGPFLATLALPLPCPI